eukprot:3230543-Prymnesium_polylepis.1
MTVFATFPPSNAFGLRDLSGVTKTFHVPDNRTVERLTYDIAASMKVINQDLELYLEGKEGAADQKLTDKTTLSVLLTPGEEASIRVKVAYVEGDF